MLTSTQDMSPALFGELAPTSVGEIQVTWNFVAKWWKPLRSSSMPLILRTWGCHKAFLHFFSTKFLSNWLRKNLKLFFFSFKLRTFTIRSTFFPFPDKKQCFGLYISHFFYLLSVHTVPIILCLHNFLKYFSDLAFFDCSIYWFSWECHFFMNSHIFLSNSLMTYAEYVAWPVQLGSELFNWRPHLLSRCSTWKKKTGAPV